MIKRILFATLLFIFMLYCLYIGDEQIASFMDQIRNTQLTEVVILLTQMGGFIFIACLLLGMMVLIRKTGIFYVFICLGGQVINVILKHLFQRERPSGLHLVEETSFSFPSGHAMASMIFYGLLIILVEENVSNQKLRIMCYSILGSIIVLVGFSRIYLNVHYASDVLGGFLFGFIYLCIVKKVIKQYKTKVNRKVVI